MTPRGLEHCSAHGVHTVVLDMLRNEPRGRYLDAATGTGALVPHLLASGFSVEACDLDPTTYAAGHPECRSLNLDYPLPYPDRSLDGIICLEALEHLRQPRCAFLEFARTLRPGGCLIISTPNIQSIYSRLHFLLFGTFDFFDTMSPDSEEAFWLRRGHITPLCFPVIRHALLTAGFTIEAVATNRRVTHGLAGGYVIRAVALVAERLLSLVVRSATAWKYAGDRGAQFLTSGELLHGENLIVKAKRNADEH